MRLGLHGDLFIFLGTVQALGHEVEIIIGLLLAVAAGVAGDAGGRGVPDLPRDRRAPGSAFRAGPAAVVLRPDLVFLLFLPPLLYFAGIQTTWRDFKENIRPITLLAVGLVLFTTCAVAIAARG